MNKVIYIIFVILIVSMLVFIKRPVTGSEVNDSALKSFSDILEKNKRRKTYHMELLHFGFDLGDGNKIEWTKNTRVSELDLLIVLNAIDFKSAMIDVNALNKDWIYKKDEKTNEELLIHAIDISSKNKVSYGAVDGMRRLFSQKKSIVSYVNDKGYYSIDLHNGFEILFGKEEATLYSFAIIVNIDELMENGLSKSALPSNWELYDDNHIIRYFNLGEV